MDVADISSGTTPSRAMHDRYYSGGTIPWVKTLDLTNGIITRTDEMVTELAVTETSLRVHPPGTVLVAMYGGFNQIGRTGLLSMQAATNQAISAIRLNALMAEPRFCQEYLNFRVSKWRDVAISSRKDANITGGDVRNFVLTFPPLEEQRAIAAALNDVDALIAALDALIAKKRDIKQATMQQLLTGKTRLPGFSGAWETRRLGDFATFLRNGTHSRAELDDESSVRNLHYGDIHASTSTFFDAAADEIPKLAPVKARGIDRLTDGDLVFVDASEDTKGVGKAVEVIGCEGVELVAGLHTIAVRFSKSTLADRFKAFLPCTPAFRHQLLRLAAGTKVLATSSRHVASVTLPLPPLAEQRAIAEVLTDLDAELAALDARREKTRLIKQGMMQALLTGQVRLV